MAEQVEKLADRVHPLYEDNVDTWELYYNAAKGGENFITDENLYSHRLEDGVDYDERLERAYFLNFCDTIPNIYNSYIFKEGIERPQDEVLAYFRTDTNGKGLTITDLVKKAGYFASLYGVVHALVAPPPTGDSKVVTKAQQKEQNINPRVSLIYPGQLVDWSIDSYGHLRWILLKSNYYRDEDPSVEREEEEHYKLITREDWKIEDSNGDAVTFEDAESSGPNTLGFIPLVTMYHKNIDDNMIGESLIKDIIFINRIILNWCSCIDEQIERQTFSQLVVPDDGTLAEASESGDDPLHKIGTSSIWTFSGEANHPPTFISPNVENLQVIWKITIDHIKEIYRLARLIGSSEDMYASKSGRAAQLGFMSVNSALADKAGSYQQFENEISKVAYAQLSKDAGNFVETKYPSTFDIAGLADELDSNLKLMERNFSPTLNKTIQKNMSRKAVPTATQEEKKKIESEIDAGTGIVEPLSTTDADGGVGGNPNLNKLADTHTSKSESDAELTKKQKQED